MTADTQTKHLLYAMHCATSVLSSYVITDVSIGN